MVTIEILQPGETQENELLVKETIPMEGIQLYRITPMKDNVEIPIAITALPISLPRLNRLATYSLRNPTIILLCIFLFVRTARYHPKNYISHITSVYVCCWRVSYRNMINALMCKIESVETI